MGSTASSRGFQGQWRRRLSPRRVRRPSRRKGRATPPFSSGRGKGWVLLPEQWGRRRGRGSRTVRLSRASSPPSEVVDRPQGAPRGELNLPTNLALGPPFVKATVGVGDPGWSEEGDDRVEGLRCVRSTVPTSSVRVSSTVRMDIPTSLSEVYRITILEQ